MVQRVLAASSEWSNFLVPEMGAFSKLTKEQVCMGDSHGLSMF